MHPGLQSITYGCIDPYINQYQSVSATIINGSKGKKIHTFLYDLESLLSIVTFFKAKSTKSHLQNKT